MFHGPANMAAVSDHDHGERAERRGVELSSHHHPRIRLRQQDDCSLAIAIRRGLDRFSAGGNVLGRSVVAEGLEYCLPAVAWNPRGMPSGVLAQQ